MSKNPNLKLQYIDSEHDYCTLSSCAEWDCMFSVFPEATLFKLFVVDCGNTSNFNQPLAEPQKIKVEDLHQQATLLIRNYKTREELEQAKSLLLRSLEGASHPSSFSVNILYDISCVESLLNHIDDAYHWLLKAIEAGFCDFQHMQNDPDLNNLRFHPNYNSLVTQQPSSHESRDEEANRKIEEEQKLVEKKRIEEEQKLAEQMRIEEEERLAQQRRIEEEQRRIEEEQKLAEQKRIEEEQRIAEQRRIEEEQRIAEQRRIEEEQRLAEQKKN